MDELDGDQDLEHEQRLGQRGEHLQAGAQGCPEGQAGPWMRLLTSPGSPGGAGAAAGAGVDSPSRYTRARGRRQDDAGGKLGCSSGRIFVVVEWLRPSPLTSCNWSPEACDVVKRLTRLPEHRLGC